MKILFLDIDGCLNSHQSAAYFHRLGVNPNKHFCPIALSNLLSILEEFPDLRLVISSTWRLGETLESMQQKLGSLGVPAERIISLTPRHPRNHDGVSVPRGEEIAAWLKMYGKDVSHYVILDDDADMAGVQDALVQVDEWHGLMRRDAVAIMDRFYHPWLQATGWELQKHREKLNPQKTTTLNDAHGTTTYWGDWEDKGENTIAPEEYEDLATAKQVESPEGDVRSFIKKV